MQVIEERDRAMRFAELTPCEVPDAGEIASMTSPGAADPTC